MERYVSDVMEIEKIPKAMRDTVCEEMQHGVEVSNLAVLIAKELNEKEEFCRNIEIAGILHDIGKLKLMKYLYSQDGLIVEQMKYVRQHTAQSYEMMRDAGYDEILANAVFHHHENFDGSGYPDNLRGEDIPYMARILRVCDVFIALTSKRVYRNAFDPKSALEIMIDEVGDYDMHVFLAFQRVVHRDVFQEGIASLKEIRDERQLEPLKFFVKEMQHTGN